MANVRGGRSGLPDWIDSVASMVRSSRMTTGDGPVTVFDPMFPIHWNVAAEAG